ncbi:hypothetical protein DMENIID0001_004910 [Sergentomyia squamirostris]
MNFESTRVRAPGQGEEVEQQLEETLRKLRASRAETRRLENDAKMLRQQYTMEEDPEMMNEQLEYLDEDEDEVREALNRIEPPVSIPEWNISAVREPEKTVEISAERSAEKSMATQVAKIAVRQHGLKELPSFAGNVEDWENFYAQYQISTVMGGYTSAENVARLEKCVTGEARRLVKTLLRIPSAADTIIEVLKERYGNPRQQYQLLVKQTLEIPAPRDDKPMTVLDFAADVRNIVEALQHLDNGAFVNHTTILDELEKKLTPIMRYAWAEIIQGKTSYTVVDLMNWLQKSARLIQAVNITGESERPKVSEKSQEEKKPKFKGRGVFTATTGGRCAMCSQGHYIAECTEFQKLSTDQRMGKVMELMLCRICLGRKHKAFQCFKKKECGVDGCKRLHHQLLHSAKKETNQTSTEQIEGKI